MEPLEVASPLLASRVTCVRRQRSTLCALVLVVVVVVVATVRSQRGCDRGEEVSA